MAQAAKAIGNVELEALFVRSSEMLERPNTVVFNPSYVSSLPSTSFPLFEADWFRLFAQAVPLIELYRSSFVWWW